MCSVRPVGSIWHSGCQWLPGERYTSGSCECRIMTDLLTEIDYTGRKFLKHSSDLQDTIFEFSSFLQFFSYFAL